MFKRIPMLINKIPIILLITTIIACTSREQAAEVKTNPEPDSTTATTMPDNALAQNRQDTLMIEGMPEPVSLNLYRSPQSWPLQFHTYLPPGMEAETTSSGEGNAVQFSFNEARINFFTFPEGISRSEAQKQAYNALGSRSVTPCDNEWEWQWGCYYSGSNPEQVNQILMGEHEGRYFYYLIRYPAAYGDGFGPRYRMLLEHWRWEE
ncbi:hypothetical protein [Cesiribacter sp. SM1]|uniref:hypothetical protein n=1 Tax=Cesiribacter sp. SM1 TaxID=2861196 RepID=UPI001CD4B9DE|nr:hypothetical protein [Cesiribacter sp. SM1]